MFCYPWIGNIKTQHILVRTLQERIRINFSGKSQLYVIGSSVGFAGKKIRPKDQLLTAFNMS